MKIYFAGKISPWRDALMPDLQDKSSFHDEQTLLEYLDKSISPYYAGPLFSKYDHVPIGTELASSKQEIHTRNLQAIKDADALIAYLDAADAYGTIYEIGYAAALKKRVYILMPETFNIPLYNDLWFVLHDTEVTFVKERTILWEIKKIIKSEKENAAFRYKTNF